MEIIYSWIWETGSLGCIPEIEGKQDYVVIVNWRIRGTYNPTGEPNSAISVDNYGQQTLQVVEGSEFIPFDELTPEIVIGWLEPLIDVPAIEASIAAQIESIVNPPIVYPSVPWESTTNG